MAGLRIQIPKERLSIQFSRSGGPGGQNVNKVETKAEVRFALADADWIPDAVRARLRSICAGNLTKEGELVLSSSRHRTQAQNLSECFEKLSRLLTQASIKPKRRIATRPTRGSRERTARQKRHRSERKQARGWRGDE